MPDKVLQALPAMRKLAGPIPLSSLILRRCLNGAK
jgi:hypothetical protein